MIYFAGSVDVSGFPASSKSPRPVFSRRFPTQGHTNAGRVEGCIVSLASYLASPHPHSTYNQVRLLMYFVAAIHIAPETNRRASCNETRVPVRWVSRHNSRASCWDWIVHEWGAESDEIRKEEKILSKIHCPQGGGYWRFRRLDVVWPLASIVADSTWSTIRFPDEFFLYLPLRLLLYGPRVVPVTWAILHPGDCRGRSDIERRRLGGRGESGHGTEISSDR